MNRKKLKNSGITLIALVITIIVLLILAGVSIATLTGNNGLLNKTSESKTQTVHASIYEQMQIEQMSYITEKNISGGNKTFEEYLNEKGIIGNDEIGEEGSGKWQINVSVLLGSNQVLGNGDATDELKDVYVLEKQSTSSGSIVNKKIATIAPIKVAEASTGEATYKVVYYGKDEQDIAEIGTITDNTVSNLTEDDTVPQELLDFFIGKNSSYVQNTEYLQSIFGIDAAWMGWDNSYNDCILYKGKIYAISYTPNYESWTDDISNITTTNINPSSLGEKTKANGDKVFVTIEGEHSNYTDNGDGTYSVTEMGYTDIYDFSGALIYYASRK